VTRAEDIEEVLLNRSRAFDRGRFVSRILGPLIGSATSMLDGEEWTNQRRLTAPAYATEQLDGYRAETGQVVQNLVEKWECRGEIDAQREGMHLWTRALARIFCGRDLDREADNILDPIREGLDGIGISLKMGTPLPLWVPLPHIAAIRRGRNELRSLGEHLLRSHVSSADPKRLASLLVADASSGGWTRSRDDLSNNIAVGGHQMMTAFCWTLFCLCENPNLQEELRLALRDEPTGGPASPEADLLERTVKESLRLYPPFYLIPRVASRDVELGGFRILKGELVVTSPWVTQRSPLYYANPEEFVPERWRDSEKRPHRFAQFPFGGGPRACVAASVIPALLAVAVATLLRGHRIHRVHSGPIKPVAGLSLSMSQPLIIGVTPVR
jgi:cytochrome P450